MQRIKSIDLARGFTVLFIPAVHSVLMYSQPYVYDTLFGKCQAFVAEWPGAQVFMLLMGVSFALSKQKSFKRVLLRSLVLLAAGYILNALKFLVPYFSSGLPKDFMLDAGTNGWQQLLLIGDIFHFAAIALIILYLVKRLRDYPVIAIQLAVAICFISPYLWDLHCSNVIANHFLLLLTGEDPKVYFPLFPWIVYPLTGLAIGYLIKRWTITHTVLFLFGSSLLLVSTSIFKSGVYIPTSFYRAMPWDVLRHLGFVMLWLALWYWAAKFIADNLLFRFLVWCSKRITLIYVIQWPLIFWLLPVIGYQQLDLLSSVVVSMVITAVVLMIAFCFAERKKSPPPSRTVGTPPPAEDK